MYLKKLILTHFKNYESQSFSFCEHINCFVGLNGAGKTNLLDAVYYLCMCKSYFLPSDLDVILRGSDFMRLEGHFIRHQKNEKIVAKVQPRKKKIIERNDVVYNALSEHIGLLPVVLFAPDDTLLAKEGSDERRRFIDTALSQIDNQYLINLIFYNKILEQRNALLKKKDTGALPDKNQKGTYQEDIEPLLSIYDKQMSEPARFIYEKRKEFIEHFIPVFNTIYNTISGGRESVKIMYQSPLIETSLTQLLRNSREKDRILQRTTVGIHKDDFLFDIDDKPLKRFGSQGQLKSFVIALKLAQFEILRGLKNEVPILLLDDIFDKLDDTRVENLLQHIINQSFGQVFISDTHEDRINQIVQKLNTNYKVFNIKNEKK